MVVGAAALLCAGALHPGYVPRRRRRAHRFHSAICVIAADAFVRVQAQRARSIGSRRWRLQLAACKALEFLKLLAAQPLEIDCFCVLLACHIA